MNECTCETLAEHGADWSDPSCVVHGDPNFFAPLLRQRPDDRCNEQNNDRYNRSP